MEEPRRSIAFTLPELWLLHAFVRHEMPQQDLWRMPPADEELNEQIALAIEACENLGLANYPLHLTRHHLLTIDYLIRYDFKTPEGARGKDILLKTFRARRELAYGLPDEAAFPDAESSAADTYREVVARRSALTDPKEE